MIMNAKLFNESLRTNCLGEYVDRDGNECILYIQFNNETESMEVGTCSNIGLNVGIAIKYDFDFSIYSNVSNVPDELERNGYSLI